MTCQGDAGQYCGASQRLAVYKAGTNAPPPTATFSSTSAPKPTTTKTSTTAAPKPTTTKTSTVAPKPTSTAPSKPAPTTAAVSGFTSLGCFVDSVDARTLRGTGIFRADNMTPATCTARCKAQGFKFAGVEYGKEVRFPLPFRVPFPPR